MVHLRGIYLPIALRSDYLAQGQAARLFPVLSTTSKEGRTTLIVLATLPKLKNLARPFLDQLGKKTGMCGSMKRNRTVRHPKTK